MLRSSHNHRSARSLLLAALVAALLACALASSVVSARSSHSVAAKESTNPTL
jgi:H+/gluconate symporter-like permease